MLAIVDISIILILVVVSVTIYLETLIIACLMNYYSFNWVATKCVKYLCVVWGFLHMQIFLIRWFCVWS